MLEGVRLVEAAIEAGAEFRIVLYGPRLVETERGRSLVARLSLLSAKAHYVSEKILSDLAEVETSQGVLAVASMRIAYREYIHPSPLPTRKRPEVFDTSHLDRRRASRV